VCYKVLEAGFIAKPYIIFKLIVSISFALFFITPTYIRHMIMIEARSYIRNYVL